MKRFILTGTPGSGKTALLRYLEVLNYVVVEEAATDIIALEQAKGITKPWMHPSFIEKILFLQKKRQIEAAHTPSIYQFFDRSPICTYALSVYLNYEPSQTLIDEIENCKNIYEKDVFFIENLGFCTPSNSRTITFEEALKFELIHKEAYEKFDYSLITIPPASLEKRVDDLLHYVV